MEKNKLNIDDLDQVAGGDLADTAKVLIHKIVPHVHDYFTTSKEPDGTRTDKCSICGALRYLNPNGEEITEEEYRIKKSGLGISTTMRT